MGKTALATVMRRVRPDHRTLTARPAWALVASGVSGNRSAVRVLVACAPSRALRPASIDPDLAIPFIRSSFPGMFPDEPALSLPREGVKFTVSPEGSPSDGFVWAWASGRVDLSVLISLEPGADGRFVIPILEILRPITLLADAVSGPAYSHVYGRTRCGLPRHFDWFIAVSTDLVHPADGATVPGATWSSQTAVRSGPGPASTRSARQPDTPVTACGTGTRDAPSRSCSHCSSTTS
jgi:hypothetical protein